MHLFETILNLNGFPIYEARKALTDIKAMDFNQFQGHTENLRQEIFNFHKANNKHYQNLVGNAKAYDWNTIPVLTKKSIQCDIEERLSHGYIKRNVYIHNTSGSSGNPFFFAKDKFAHAMTWALIFDRYNRHSIDLNGSLQARFFGIPLSRTGYLIEKTKDKLSNRVRFPIFDLSDKVLKEYTVTFSKRPFEYLNGYTSSLVLFARYLISNGIILNEICPTLKRCITTSEICSLEDRILMERAFGVRVINEYGAAELDLIAFEDESFDWIMSNENLFFEVVDEDNKPVGPGVEGKLLVTSLYNKAMPFIRYELGDVVRIEKDWKGNNQILGSLIGRTNDIAILPSGKKSPGLTFYYISKGLLEEGGGMKEFIIKQTSPSHFIYEYVSDNILTKEQERKVRSLIDIYLEPGLDSEFIKVDKISRTAAGKLRHFQKLF